MKVVICWIGVSGYLAACWRALAARPGIDLRLVLFPTVGNANAPFRADLAEGLPADLLEEKHTADVERVVSLVAAHSPQIVVIPGWVVPSFKALATHPKLRGAKFILTMDTPRRDNWRQKFARLKLGRFLDRMDRIIVPGERSWQYARQLQFPESKIRRGLYGVNFSRWQSLYDRRLTQPGGWPKRFLFTGRYVPVKGIDVLMEAYALYRTSHRDAWPLSCCGSGPMSGLLKSAGEGVEDLGFVQPQDQPDVWSRSGVMVLASRFDPWPLVIVEACAAGLPVLCTEACGSSVELVRSHYNGLAVATGDAAALARGLALFHERYDQLPEMGQRGQQMAAPYSAEMWAERWMRMFEELI